MPLASPWSHAFIGSLLSCRGMCSFTVNKKCNLPLVCPQCSSYYKGSVVRCVGCVVPLSLTTRILLPPVWGTTIASLSAAFSRIYSLAFETGTLHIGGFGPCQIILLPLQAPEPGAIACGDSGEFKRTLYLEKHSTERGTVPEKPANNGCQPYSLGCVMDGYQKSSRGFPCESLDSLYVRDQPDMDVKCKGLDTKATAASTKPTHSPKLRVEVRNKGRNASFCCQSGHQSRLPSHSLAQQVSLPSLLDLCPTFLTPQHLPTFQFPLWWKKAVLFLLCTCEMTSNRCLGLWVLDLGTNLPWRSGNWFLSLLWIVTQCSLTGLETVWLQVPPQRPANCRTPCSRALWHPGKSEATSFVPLFQR